MVSMFPWLPFVIQNADIAIAKVHKLYFMVCSMVADYLTSVRKPHGLFILCDTIVAC